MTTHLNSSTPPEPITVEPFALPLAQVLSMLMAAQAQGATRVQVAIRTLDRKAVGNGIDWISMHPVDGCVYLGAIGQPPAWDCLAYEALDSLDWTGVE